MRQSHLKKTAVLGLLCFASYANAEGIIDIKPYISPSITYDDNVFRFSSEASANAAFGSPEMSDVIKRLDFGTDVNLRLSRQLVNLNVAISDSKYNRFDLLDNTAKSYGLSWSWRLGNDVYGTLSKSKSESIAGFNEIRNPVKNTRIVDRQSASANWSFHPDWAVFISQERVDTENEIVTFQPLDREDVITESGLRYQNPLGTQLSLSYRLIESDNPNRTGFSAFFFGNESRQKSLIATAAWLPSPKTRISTRLSQVSIDYKNRPQRTFSGFNQRWDISHALTAKINLNAAAYKEVSPIDDIASTYVEITGASFNPVWNLTSKLALRAGFSYEDRDYLGSAVGAGIFFLGDRRSDTSKVASLGLIYSPTEKSLLQLQYQGEDRDSTADIQSYRFNSISLTGRYSF
ncbi:MULTISPECIES: XrtB/PEP-CTERM-associated polysaccharide biosynthesis outer membrane protein EpsL [Methylotenera]|uniref:XrtB/PEP-CTERM-associated polysaccharide biosynthesis outer membrane protein EpsL n=1 Tax=Methylotenera TaxID=359407 RepID=UPI00035C0FA1|nr:MULTISPECIES: XrtB/PEP-CTERM-associated polysaccharide biosynthesis outer membrane protein EpsL [Methylotenera]